MNRGIVSARVLATSVALGLAAGALLAGCAEPSDEEEGDILDPGLTLMDDRLPDGATPGFVTEALESEPGPDDLPPCDMFDGLDLRYSRFQGEYEGTRIYLIATPATDGVLFVTTIGDAGCGSSPAGLGALGSGDPMSIVYLPSGTAHVDIPEGWHVLSDWIAVRD